MYKKLNLVCDMCGKIFGYSLYYDAGDQSQSGEYIFCGGNCLNRFIIKNNIILEDQNA